MTSMAPGANLIVLHISKVEVGAFNIASMYMPLGITFAAHQSSEVTNTVYLKALKEEVADVSRYGFKHAVQDFGAFVDHIGGQNKAQMARGIRIPRNSGPLLFQLFQVLLSQSHIFSLLSTGIG